MFKRLLQKKDSKTSEVSNSEDSNGDALENSGFICPTCYWGFLNPEDLQQHWEKEHGDEGGKVEKKETPKNTSAVLNDQKDSSKIWNERTGSLLSFDEESHHQKDEDTSLLDTTLQDLEEKSAEVFALQREINDINAALKEEKWYSSALKEEVEKLENEKQQRSEDYQKLEKEKGENEKAYEEKIKLFEQEKTKENDRLKQELVQALEARSGSQEEQLSLVQKSSQINTELVALQGKLKDEEQRRCSLEKQCEAMKEELDCKIKTINELETDLAQRPAVGHVASLQTHIASLEDQLKTAKTERENERNELKEKYQVAMETAKGFETKVSELKIEKSSKVEQIQSLQTALEAASDYRKQVEGTYSEKQQLVLSIQHELDQTKVVVKEKEQFVEYLQKQLEETKNNYQIELSAKDEISQEARKLQHQLEEQMRQSETKEIKLIEFEKAVAQSKTDIARMEEERNDLFSKIEAGEGITTAINQLNQEKDQLEERLVDCEKQMENQTKESGDKIEQLHQRNNQITEELEQSRQNENKLSFTLKEKCDEVDNLNQTLVDTKEDLRKKSEALVAVEASKATERNVLEEQRRSRDDTLQRKIAEFSGLQQEYNMLKDQLSSNKESAVVLQLENTSIKEQLASKTVFCSELEAQIKKQTEHLESLKSENETAKSTFEETSEKQKEQIDSLTEKLNQTSQESNVKISFLEQEKIQVEVKLETLLNSLKEKEEECAVMQTQLTKVAEEKGALQEKLDNTTKMLEDISSQLDSRSKQFELVKESLQTEASSKETELRSQLSDLMSSLKSLKEKSSLLELKYEEKCKESESQIGQLESEKKGVEQQLASRIQVHTEEIAKWEAKHLDVQQTMEQKVSDCKSLEETVVKKDDQLQELRQKIEGLEQRLQKPCESCKDYDNKLCRMQELLNQEKQHVSSKDSEIQEANSRIEVLSQDIANVRQENDMKLSVAAENEGKLKDVITHLAQEKSDGETRLSEMTTLLNEEKMAFDNIVKEKEALQESLKAEEQKYKDLEEIKFSVDENCRSLENKLELERGEKQKVIGEMEEKQAMLIAQKVEIQNQMSTLQASCSKAQEELEDTKEATKRAQNLLKTEMDGLTEKLQNEKEQCERLKQNIQDTESRLNIKIAASNENVVSARNELNKKENVILELQQEIKDKESQQFELKGEMAVLEATIENNQDEKRSLLERCLASQENTERYQKTIEKLNKKIEELNSAMIELGQENQNLQVVQSKRSNRKWEKDNEVHQCNGCSRAFSVSIRKHHCRNCGSIFCADCTAKAATVAASKKPVRVCDPCYNELNVPMRSYSLGSTNSSS